MRMRLKAVTLIELLVVLLIIGILSTLAVGVYTGQVERARIAAAKDTIHQLEVALHRYEIDVGTLPPSGTGTNLAPNPPNSGSPARGSGYLQLALSHSLNGNALAPLDKRWFGPYVEFDINRLGDVNGAPQTNVLTKPEVNFLDPWGMPFYYIKYPDYAAYGGTERVTSDPYRDTETYYNPSTVQIFSFGPNRKTLEVPQRGIETDDINNWGYYLGM